MTIPAGMKYVMIVITISTTYSILRSIWNLSCRATIRPINSPTGIPFRAITPRSIGSRNFIQTDAKITYITIFSKNALSVSSGKIFCFCFAIRSYYSKSTSGLLHSNFDVYTSWEG